MRLRNRALEHAFKDWLRDQGYRVLLVGRGIGRQDLFGCFDFLAIRGSETWAGNTTVRTGAAARKRKIEEQEWPRTWRRSVIYRDDRLEGMCLAVWDQERDPACPTCWTQTILRLA